MTFAKISEIVRRAERKDAPGEFFGGFRAAWEGVRCQVLKLETRQTYQEPDSASWRALVAGDWSEALRLLEESRAEDVDLYADLQRRQIDFTRCRPVTFPMSDYLRWEFQIYRFNAAHGERIFCCNRTAVAEVFDQYATHDFMVFDARHAFIHDYNEAGLIQGGWWVHSQEDIISLLGLYAFIRANCQPFNLFETT